MTPRRKWLCGCQHSSLFSCKLPPPRSKSWILLHFPSCRPLMLAPTMVMIPPFITVSKLAKGCVNDGRQDHHSTLLAVLLLQYVSCLLFGAVSQLHGHGSTSIKQHRRAVSQPHVNARTEPFGHKPEVRSSWLILWYCWARVVKFLATTLAESISRIVAMRSMIFENMFLLSTGCRLSLRYDEQMTKTRICYESKQRNNWLGPSSSKYYKTTPRKKARIIPCEQASLCYLSTAVEQKSPNSDGVA